MRLISCYIEGFGKLRKIKINFDEGFNCFVKENGWGKSTFAAFLRIMFYGFDGESKRNELENERKYYKPWTGDSYGGELVFQTGDRLYRIQRLFGAKKSEDEFALYDVETNMSTDDFSENIGEELFQIDAQSFQRTVYIGQNECGTWTTDGINAKIGNISDESSDINNYDKACTRLKSVINGMSPTKKTGELYKQKKDISALKERVRKTGIVEARIEKLRDRRDSIVQMRAASSEYQHNVAEKNKAAGYFPLAIPEIKELQGKIERAREYEKLKAYHEAAKMSEKDRRSYSELMHTYYPDSDMQSGGIHLPSDMELDKCMAFWNDIKQNRMEIYRLKRQLKNVMDDQPEDKLAADDTSAKKGAARACILCAVTVFIIMVLLRAANLIDVHVFAIWLLISLMGVAAFIIMRNRRTSDDKKRANLKKQYADDGMDAGEHSALYKDIQDMIAMDEQQIDINFAKIQNITDGYGMCLDLDDLDGSISGVRRLIDLQRKMHTDENAAENCNSAREELSLYIECLGFVPGEDLLSQLIEIQRRLEDYHSRCQAVSGVSGAKEMDRDKMEYQAGTNIDSRIAECDMEIAALTGELNEIKEMAVQLEQIQPEFDSDLRKYELIARTYELLGQAKEIFTARYTVPVMKAFTDYHACIMGIQEDMQMNADMDISYRDHGMYRNKKTLSAGLKDLTDICERVAMVDVMYPVERPVLIMDDPFVNLDDENMAGAKRLLSLLEEKYQIIYFTCSKNRVL